jgi:hypothetical protein
MYGYTTTKLSLSFLEMSLVTTGKCHYVVQNASNISDILNQQGF